MDDDDQTTLPMSPGAVKERDERILKAVERSGRSPCFWWLYDRYESMRTADGKLRMTWRECCASLTAIGVTAMDGRPLTPATTRETWRKVVEQKRHDAARGYQSPYSEAERGDDALMMDDGEKDGANRAETTRPSKKATQDV